MNIINPKTIAITVGVALILGIVYYLMNSSPKRIFARAMKMHQKGEAYYDEGDVELAQEYYTEAERLRERARGMVA